MKTVLHLTDLHFEFNKQLIDYNSVISEKKADWVFLTGDIAGGTYALPFIKHLLKLGYKVFYVLGNHEFYGYDIDLLISEWRSISKSIDGFYFLENESVVIDDIEVFGSCLWTSMGTSHKNENLDILFKDSVSSNADFKYTKNWTPEKMKERFYSSWEKLQKIIENSKAKHKVVLTHYLPSYQSVDVKYLQSLINPFFATELGNYIAYSDVNFWFHGHTHDSFDYFIYNTNIICNPFGYKDKNMLNRFFNWNKITKIGDVNVSN
jgi:Icc-related predicted phosphoesterase